MARYDERAALLPPPLHLSSIRYHACHSIITAFAARRQRLLLPLFRLCQRHAAMPDAAMLRQRHFC